MPVPTVAPDAEQCQLERADASLQLGGGPWATGAPRTGRVRNICSTRLMGGTAMCSSWVGPSRLSTLSRVGSS